MIIIDQGLCTGCSRCMSVCPMKVIELNDRRKSEPVRPGLCVHCAHCMSVCPHGAISADFTESVLGKSTRNIDMPSTTLVENLMLTRRSIRAYSKKTVEKETIEKILQIAVHSPTAHNNQDVKFIVVDSEKTGMLEEMAHDYFAGLADNDYGLITREAGFKILLGAPAAIALYSKKSDEGDTNLSLWNCLIAAQGILITAHGMGLGGCYNGLLLYAYNNYPKLQDFFNMPEDMKIYMFVVLGHIDPKIKYRHFIKRLKPDIIWK